MEQSIYQLLPQALLPWYYENKRRLPWREDKDPYHVWISEIMLQQTRVEAVKGYYSRFLEAVPTVQALAACGDDVLTKLWEGLGYYSRVRNLKKAAICVCEQYGGVFPVDYDKVRALPGIGDYTAGAICSICYDQPTPAVDGNVLRVCARLTDDDTPIDTPAMKRKVTSGLEAVYPNKAGDFTQALMELGATVCGPNKAPACSECPCREFCRGYLRGTASSLPVKRAKTPRRTEKYTVFILRCGDRFALEKRPESGLLAGLWQFPNAAQWLNTHEAAAWLQEQGIRVQNVRRVTQRQHIFTHICWQMQGYYFDVAETGRNYIWMTGEDVTKRAALPTAFRQFWEGSEDV